MLPDGLNWLCYFAGSLKSHRENSISFIFLESPHQVGMKNVVNSSKHFFGYFNTLGTQSVVKPCCDQLKNYLTNHFMAVNYISTSWWPWANLEHSIIEKLYSILNAKLWYRLSLMRSTHYFQNVKTDWHILNIMFGQDRNKPEWCDWCKILPDGARIGSGT